MNELLLRDGENHELRFTGELLVESTGDVEFDDQRPRKFIAKTYAVAGGGFVCSLEYQTTSEWEDSINLIESLDLMAEVEKFFYVFEPDEIFVDSQDLPPEELAKRPVLRKRVAAAYEAATFDLLDHLQTVSVPNGLDNKPADPAVEK